MTSHAAKSRRDVAKLMSHSDLVAKITWKLITLINCVFQNYFFVTQCNHFTLRHCTYYHNTYHYGTVYQQTVQEFKI